MGGHGKTLELQKIGPAQPILLTHSKTVHHSSRQDDFTSIPTHPHTKAELDAARAAVAEIDDKRAAKAAKKWNRVGGGLRRQVGQVLGAPRRTRKG